MTPTTTWLGAPRDGDFQDNVTPTVADRLILLLRALRRRWPYALMVLLVTLGAAVAFVALMPKQYEATAKVLLTESEEVNALLTPEVRLSSSDREREVTTNFELLKLEPLADRVRQRLGLRESRASLLDRVEFEGESGSNIASIQVRGEDPEGAAAIANGFAAEYAALRLAAARASIDQAARLARERLASRSAASRSDRRTARSGEDEQLRERIRRLTVASSLQTGGVRVIEWASTPTEASAPRPVVTLGAATVVGLGLALLSVLLLESFDKRLRDENDVEAALGLPILAVVGSEKGNGFGQAGFVRQEGFDGREDYLRLASALRSSGHRASSHGFVVLIASIDPEQGTSNVLAWLGRALAMLGQRVIAIDGDPHASQASRASELPSGGGLGTLSDPSFFEDQLVEIPVVPETAGAPSDGGSPPQGSLRLLPFGFLPPPSPQTLLASQAMSDLVDRARATADVVLIGGPPVLPRNDAGLLAHLADTILVLVRLGQTRGDRASQGMRLMRAIQAPVLGTVLIEPRAADDAAPRSARRAGDNSAPQSAEPAATSGPLNPHG